MPIKDLNRKDIDEILLKVGTGHLGTVNSDGKPYVVPIGFNYVDGIFYMFFDFDTGEKLDNILGNPNICLEVTSQEPLDSVLRSGARWHILSSVIVRGNAEIIINEIEKAKVWGEDTITRLHRLRPGGVYCKMKPEKITGRSFTRTA